MAAVVVGATGGVGRWVVSTLLADPRIVKVTAVGRKVQSPDAIPSFYKTTPKVAAAKLNQVVIDYDALDTRAFADNTIGFSCLGMYTAAVESEAQFLKVERDMNVAAAKAMIEGGVKRYSYLSGMGVNQKGSMMMFARVKGVAERDLQALGFERATMARPGGIRKRMIPDGKMPIMDRANNMLIPDLFGIDAQQIAQAMVHSTLKEGVGSKEIFSNSRLHAESREYKASLKN